MVDTNVAVILRRSVAVVVGLLVTLTHHCSVATSAGGIQIRISESELTKVANIVYSPENNNFLKYTDGQRVTGTYDIVDYTISNVREVESDPPAVEVKLQDNNRMQVTFENQWIALQGQIQITNANDKSVSNFGLNMRVKGVSTTVMAKAGSDEDGIPAIAITTCSVQVNDTVLPDDIIQSFTVDVDTGIFATEILKKLICEALKKDVVESITLPFGLPLTTRSEFYLIKEIDIVTNAVDIRIEDNILVFTHKVFVQSGEIDMSLPVFPPVSFRPVNETRGFEIWFNQELFNVVLADFADVINKPWQKSGKRTQMSSILPMFDIVDNVQIEKLGIIFANVSDMYKGAMAKAYATRIFGWLTFKNNSAYAELLLSGHFDAEWNCEDEFPISPPTQTMFKLDTHLVIPIQAQYTDTDIGIIFKNFGGNITVHDSAIGPIVDRQTKNLMYIAQKMYGENAFTSVDALPKTIKLRKFLPPGVVAENAIMKLIQGYTIFGANVRAATDNESTGKPKSQTGDYYEEDYHLDVFERSPHHTTVTTQECMNTGSTSIHRMISLLHHCLLGVAVWATYTVM